MKQIFDRDYPVTSILLILTSLVFVLMFLSYGFQYSSSEALYHFGAVHGYTIQALPEQFWRVFAAIFIHIGLEHFVVNMLTLYFLGRQIEAIFGSWKFLILYLMSGVMGNLFVVYFSPNSLAGHLGGLVGGALGAVILPVSGERYAFSKSQRFLALAVYFGLAAILIFLTFQRPIF